MEAAARCLERLPACCWHPAHLSQQPGWLGSRALTLCAQQPSISPSLGKGWDQGGFSIPPCRTPGEVSVWQSARWDCQNSRFPGAPSSAPTSRHRCPRNCRHITSGPAGTSLCHHPGPSGSLCSQGRPQHRWVCVEESMAAASLSPIPSRHHEDSFLIQIPKADGAFCSPLAPTEPVWMSPGALPDSGQGCSVARVRRQLSGKRLAASRHQAGHGQGTGRGWAGDGQGSEWCVSQPWGPAGSLGTPQGTRSRATPEQHQDLKTRLLSVGRYDGYC